MRHYYTSVRQLNIARVSRSDKPGPVNDFIARIKPSFAQSDKEMEMLGPVNLPPGMAYVQQ